MSCDKSILIEWDLESRQMKSSFKTELGCKYFRFDQDLLIISEEDNAVRY